MICKTIDVILMFTWEHTLHDDRLEVVNSMLTNRPAAAAAAAAADATADATQCSAGAGEACIGQGGLKCRVRQHVLVRKITVFSTSSHMASLHNSSSAWSV